MDGAEASSLYLAVTGNLSPDAVTSKRDAVVALKVSDVGPPGAATDADLGGSSKYSSETLEDQCGEGFHVNSS
jgi:hypothetical protein